MPSEQALRAQTRSQRLLRAALIALILPALASALECRSSHPAEALRRTDAVFIGLVLPGGNDLAVLRSWKGDPPPTVRFFVGTDRVMERGQQYLIYGARMPGGTYAATCGVAAVRYARADIEYLDKVRSGSTPGNSVIVEPWPEKTFRNLRLRSRTRVVELRNVGVGQYYADNIPPGTWLLETGVPGYRLRDPWVVEIKPTSHLRLSPTVIAPPDPH